MICQNDFPAVAGTQNYVPDLCDGGTKGWVLRLFNAHLGTRIRDTAFRPRYYDAYGGYVKLTWDGYLLFTGSSAEKQNVGSIDISTENANGIRNPFLIKTDFGAGQDMSCDIFVFPTSVPDGSYKTSIYRATSTRYDQDEHIA